MRTCGVSNSKIMDCTVIIFLAVGAEDTHRVPCPLPPGWGCRPGSPPHAWQPPSPRHWRPGPARQTKLSGTSAQTRRWCLDWMRWPQPAGIMLRSKAMREAPPLNVSPRVEKQATHLHGSGGAARALPDVEEASGSGLRLAARPAGAATVDDHGFALEEAHQVRRLLALSHSHLEFKVSRSQWDLWASVAPCLGHPSSFVWTHHQLPVCIILENNCGGSLAITLHILFSLLDVTIVYFYNIQTLYICWKWISIDIKE